MVLQRNLANLWGEIPKKAQLMAGLAVVESKDLAFCFDSVCGGSVFPAEQRHISRPKSLKQGQSPDIVQQSGGVGLVVTGLAAGGHHEAGDFRAGQAMQPGSLQNRVVGGILQINLHCGANGQGFGVFDS